MSPISQFEDTTRCPSCGQPNECAMAAGRDPESCWCMSVSIDPDVIARLPEAARGKVCICHRCATASVDRA